VSDLVSLLLEAIKQVEQDAPKIHRTDCLLVTDEWSLQYEPDACTCGHPSSVLRGCQADSELVGKYREIQAESDRVIGHGYAEPDEMVSERLVFDWVIKNRAASYGLSVEEETTHE
jgi:hypothetical protein